MKTFVRNNIHASYKMYLSRLCLEDVIAGKALLPPCPLVVLIVAIPDDALEYPGWKC